MAKIVGEPNVVKPNAEGDERDPFLRYLLDVCLGRRFGGGYDFFISYCWADGRVYALALNSELKKRGFRSFLDSEDYEKGTNWKTEGRRALTQASRLLLIITPGSIASESVAREIRLFRRTKRTICPIDVAKVWQSANAKQLRVDIGEDILNIPESGVTEAVLARGPTEATLTDLVKSFNLRRQSERRVQALGTISIVFAVVAMVAIFFWRSSASNQQTAEHRLAALSLAHGHRLINTDGDHAAALLWYAETLHTTGSMSASARESARALIRGWSSALPHYSMVHDGPVFAVAFSPDGERIVTGSASGLVQLWDAASGQPSGPAFPPQGGAVTAAAFSPDGKTLATGCGGTITLWNLATHARRCELIRSESGRYQIYSMSFNKDGSKLSAAFGGDWSGDAIVWDVATQQICFDPLHRGDELRSVTFSPDGRMLVTAGFSGLQMWDTESGQPLATREQQISPPVPSPPTVDRARDPQVAMGSLEAQSNNPDVATEISGRVTAAAFSPDGKTLATASETVITLWDAENNFKRRVTLNLNSQVSSIAFSSSGGVLGTACLDGAIWLWNLRTSQPRVERKARHNRPVNAIAFSPHNMQMASSSNDLTCRVWEFSEVGEIEISSTRSGIALALAFTTGDDTLATAVRLNGHDEICLWNGRTGQSRNAIQLTESILGKCFSPDGRLIVTSKDKLAFFWDVLAGKHCGKPMQLDAVAHNVTFSPQGTQLAIEDENHSVSLWDSTTCRQLHKPLKHKDWVDKVVFSQNGKKIATSSRDGSLMLSDLRSGDRCKVPLKSNGKVTQLRFANNDRELIVIESKWSPEKAAYTNNVVSRWTTSTSNLRCIQSFDAGAGMPQGLSFDAQWLALIDNTIRTLELWDLVSKTAKPLQHPDNVKFVAFAFDSRFLITECQGFLYVWDVATGKLRYDPINHGNSTKKIILSNDAKTIAVADREKKAVTLWDAATGQLRGTPLRVTSDPDHVTFGVHGDRLILANDKGLSVLPVRSENGGSVAVKLSIEVRTGQTIENSVIRTLTPEELRDRRIILRNCGGDCFRISEAKASVGGQ
ncbi:MAG: TIR domain-containing protein [Planctomycetota bacterium]